MSVIKKAVVICDLCRKEVSDDGYGREITIKGDDLETVLDVRVYRGGEGGDSHVHVWCADAVASPLPCEEQGKQ